MEENNKTNEQLIRELKECRQHNRELELSVAEHEQKIDGLQKQVHFLQSIIGNNPNPIFVKNRQGQLLLVNAAFAQIYGLSVEKIVGMFDEDFLPPEQLKEARIWDLDVMNTYQEISEPVSQRKFASGDTHWVQTTKRPIPEEDGTCNKVLCVMKDVTELKEAEAALQLTRFTVEHMADAMYWMDSESRFVDVNESACKTLGYTRQQLLGMSLIDIDPTFTDERWHNVWNELKENGQLIRETKHRTIDGRIIPVEIVANYVEFEGQQLDCAIVRDITERKKTEESLRLTRFTVEHMSDALYWIDPHGRLADVNQAACRMLGYTYEELTQLSVPDIDSAYPFERQHAFRKRLRQTGTMRFETQHLTKEGQLMPVEIVANLINFGDQEFNCCFVRDITERKRAEATLQESEEKYRSLVESAQDPIFTCDEEGRYLFVNTAAAANFGTTPDKVVGKTVHDLFPAHIADKYLADVKQIFQTSEGLVIESASEINGQSYWLSNNLQPIHDNQGRVTKIQVVVRDISDLKRAEEALRQNEDRLQQAIRVSHIGIFDHDHIANTIYWSPEQRENYGWRPEEPVTLPKYLEHVYPGDVDRIREAVRRAHDPAGDGLFDVEHRIVHRDGAIRWLVTRSQTFFEGESDHRHPVRTVGAVLDMTERKQIEEALERERLLLRTVIDNLPDLIYLKDTEHRYLVSNLANARALGASLPEEVEGKTLFDFYPVEEAERYNKKDRIIMNTGQAILNQENRYEDQQTGQQRWSWMTRTPFRDPNGRIIGIVGISRDITTFKKVELERENLITALERSNRELQDFAYISSHDLQEPLRKIQVFADRFQEKYSDLLDEYGRDYLGRLQNTAARCQTLVENLLAYSRLSTRMQPFEPVDLSSVVQGVLSDLEIQIEQTSAQINTGSLPTINADETQMRQLFQNLIGNALKFYQEGVPPLVEIKSLPAKDLPKSMCRISITDNGIGFEEKYLDRIFTVFQRLHGRNEFEGTGIGLAICRRIVERHSGRIYARSSPGNGSTFIVELPVALDTG